MRARELPLPVEAAGRASSLIPAERCPNREEGESETRLRGLRTTAGHNLGKLTPASFSVKDGVRALGPECV